MAEELVCHAEDGWGFGEAEHCFSRREGAADIAEDIVQWPQILDQERRRQNRESDHKADGDWPWEELFGDEAEGIEDGSLEPTDAALSPQILVEQHWRWDQEGRNLKEAGRWWDESDWN